LDVIIGHPLPKNPTVDGMTDHWIDEDSKLRFAPWSVGFMREEALLKI
jgi:hypothetical protein